MLINVAKLSLLCEKKNQVFWNDTDEAEAGELKAGAKVNPVPQETLKKMNDGTPMMNRSLQLLKVFVHLSQRSVSFLIIFFNSRWLHTLLNSHCH